MINHYLKVAFRNLWKYRTQSIISILGLALGFVCLTLSSLWRNYENTYDTCHRDWQQLYLVDCQWVIGSRIANCGLLDALATCPEVEGFAPYWYYTNEMRIMNVDSLFHTVFDLELVEGNYEFLQDKKVVGISESYARKKYGNEPLLGKEIQVGANKVKIGAVLKPFDDHSLFPFDVIKHSSFSHEPGSGCSMVMRIRKGVNMDEFAPKLKALGGYNAHAVPLSKVHKSFGSNELNLSYAHLNTFSMASLLLVICATINFLVLYLIRLKGRSREMALRMVNGSSGRQLLVLFFLEYLLVLLTAPPLGHLHPSSTLGHLLHHHLGLQPAAEGDCTP